MFKDLFRKKGHWKGAKVKWVQKGTGIELELTKVVLFPWCGARIAYIEKYKWTECSAMKYAE